MFKTDRLWTFLLTGALPHHGCFAPEEDGANAGGGGSTPDNKGEPVKTFTAEQVNDIVSRRVNEVSKKFGDYDAIKAKAGEVDTLKKQIDDLTHQIETKGKPDDEKQRIALQRERDRLATENESTSKRAQEAEAKAEAAQLRLNRYIIDAKIADGLAKAKALPSAIAQATRLLVEDGKVELVERDGGEFGLVIRVGNLTFEDPKTAAEAWLKDNPHFAAHPGGGSGTPRADGTRNNGIDLDKMNPLTAIAIGLQNEFK